MSSDAVDRAGSSISHPADRLLAVMADSGSVACVGLDPRPDLVPPSLRQEALDRHGPTAEAVADAFVAFNRGLIGAIAGHCAAVKPQAACYEAYGPAGWRALAQTVAMAHDAGLPVIVDAKRGDIGSTATHYGDAVIGSAPGLDGGDLPGLGADWMTVNAYLGADGVAPVLDAGGGVNGVFVLVRTSNPSAGDLQDVEVAGGSADAPRTVAERMADLVHRWGGGRVGTSGLSDVGAVVGATWPDQARVLRRRMPDTLFLVPGYGAQGAGGADAMAGARADGTGVLVSSSRGIIGAWRARTDGERDWQQAARQALDAMNADLGAARR